MSYKDKCLGPSGVGIIGSDNRLTKAARDAFVGQVVALLTSGNAAGKGAKISSLLNIAFPPIPGPKLFDPDRLLTHPSDLKGDLFWFDPSPFAALTFDTLRDPSGFYQELIVDKLYAPLMNMINLNGNAPFAPILDYSGFFPPELDIKIPDLPKIALAIPDLTGLQLSLLLNIKLPDALKLVVDLPKIPSIPSIPVIPIPPIPEFDFIIFGDLFKLLLQIPVILIPKLILKLSLDPPSLLIPTPPALFNLVLDLVLDLVLKLLLDLGLLIILPKLLSATFIVMIQNLCAAMVPVVVSQIIGTGVVVKFLGQALALA